MPHVLAQDASTHSPAVSSPLNPESCYQVPTKDTHRATRPVRLVRMTPTAPPLSPTQRLLRQKAHVAWRSEVRRHAVMQSEAARIQSANSTAFEDKPADGRGGSQAESQESSPADSDIGLQSIQAEKEPLVNKTKRFPLDLARVLDEAMNPNITVRPPSPLTLTWTPLRALLVIILLGIFSIAPFWRLQAPLQ